MTVVRAPRARGEIRALVVEDEQRYRDLLLRILGEADCAAIGVRTAREALDRLESAPFDCVLLDLNLPVMDGLEFLRVLRERGDVTPVIILTGHGTLARAQDSIRLGVVDFLNKPCHLGEIEAALDRVRRVLAEDDPPAAHAVDRAPEQEARSLAEMERRAVLEAIERNNGNKSAAAAELGISRRTLYNRLYEYSVVQSDDS